MDPSVLVLQLDWNKGSLGCGLSSSGQDHQALLVITVHSCLFLSLDWPAVLWSQARTYYEHGSHG